MYEQIKHISLKNLCQSSKTQFKEINVSVCTTRFSKPYIGTSSMRNIPSNRIDFFSDIPFKLSTCFLFWAF